MSPPARTAAPPAADPRAVAAGVTDPEIPVLTIDDLGILREVDVDPGGRVVVTMTPTYSGCPAVDTIRADIVAALAQHGHHDVEVRTVLSPAWTTDWMSPDGRRKLEAYGIAPPGPRPDGPVPVRLVARRTATAVRCPRCGSTRTPQISRFGSTPCKALHACQDCLEPFDHFKAL